MKGNVRIIPILSRTLYVALFSMLPFSLLATAYYVDASADVDKAKGSLERPWADIQTALNQGLTPGDVIHIKSGEYGPDGIVLKSSGTEAAPIIIQGFFEVPGDLPRLQPDELTSIASQMPRICGSNSGEGTGIDLNGQDHILIKHVAIGNFRVGIRNMRSPSDPSEGLRLEHILGKKFGLYDNAVYSGWGILLDDEGANIRFCQITDAGAEGIGVYGDENIVHGCRVVNRTDSIATDYFIVVKGSNNRIEECEIVQDEQIVSHSGHGIGVKNGQDNLIYGCFSSNTNKGFYVSGPDCMGNRFFDCRAEGDVCYVIRDGAHDNRFEACLARNAEICVRFLESAEFGVQTYSALNNVFEDCGFTDSKTLIETRSSNGKGLTEGNAFINCVFKTSDTFIVKTSAASGNFFIDCKIEAVGQAKSRRAIEQGDLLEGFEQRGFGVKEEE